MKPQGLPHTCNEQWHFWWENPHSLVFFFVLDGSSIMAMEITMAQIPTAGATQHLNQASYQASYGGIRIIWRLWKTAEVCGMKILCSNYELYWFFTSTKIYVFNFSEAAVIRLQPPA
jgi:hypothetical protein